MNTITAEQRRAIELAGDEPLELADPATGTAFVLLRAERYRKIQEQLEEARDLREHEAWANVARRARDEWAGRESLRMTIRSGEVYLADTPSGRRPVVVLSREELNRGRWIVAVPITSARFHQRSSLPHCVPFRAGEFGLTLDCVAQAEAVSYIAISDLDLGAGPIGILDTNRLRSLVRAVGNMMGSDCEPT